jgi:hypothetical protein
MFDDTRRLTSIVYLSCLVSTLAIVFIPLYSTVKLLTLLLLMATQFVASCWYSLSYIPFGRRTAWRLLRRLCGLQAETSSGSTYTGIFGGTAI